MEDNSQKKYNLLTDEEKNAIRTILAREPNELEKEIIATLWHEDFSHKGLEKWYRKLLKTGDNIIKTADKNESYYKLNDETVLKFSVSSQNSLADKYPFSAASIAIQNVVKNTVSKGFKPIALLDSLRIGDFEIKENRQKLVRIIKALSEFSEAFNMRIVGGEMFFNLSYNNNPVINTFALGINKLKSLKKKKLLLPGHEIFLVGAYTHEENALNYEGEKQFESLADHKGIASYSAENFQEKLVHDLCEHLNDENAFTVVENIEKGGLILALSRILKGNKGANIYLDTIKTSLKKLNDLQLLFSASPARALFVINKKSKANFNNIISNSALSTQKIGEINDSKEIKIYKNNELLANFTSEILLNQNIPDRNILYKKPENRNVKEYSIKDVPLPQSLKKVAWFLLQHKNIASKRFLTKHFKNVFKREQLSDAALAPIDGKTNLIIGVDCNARYVNACPQTGAAIAVAEAARNIVCSGARPLGISACINIGNYKNPEVFWQFSEIIKGINKVSRQYNLPILEIKSDFNNFSEIDGKEVNIYPTPVIGMLGILEDGSNLQSLHFKNKGDMIFLLGETRNSISSSLYLKSFHGVKNSPPPYFNLATADKLQKLVQQLTKRELINSAHDVSNGGVLITLIEAAMEKHLGFDITTDAENREDAFLFGEAQNRIIVTVNPEFETNFIDFMIEYDFPFLTLGHVTKGDLRVDDISWGHISGAKQLFENALEQNL